MTIDIVSHCHAIRRLSKGISDLCAPTITLKDCLLDTVYHYYADRKWLTPENLAAINVLRYGNANGPQEDE